MGLSDSGQHPLRLSACLIGLCIALLCACSGDTDHTAPAVNPQDSLPFMHARGINNLISDSGVLRYRLIAEEWDIYTDSIRPDTWKFRKGLLMQRYDEKYHIDLYVQADTAYLHEQRTWELRGRVCIRNIKGDVFHTEELFWDMTDHLIWSHKYMRIVTPDRELEGDDFRSNEQMTDYFITNSAGAFPVSDMQEEETPEEDPSAEEGQDLPEPEPTPQPQTSHWKTTHPQNTPVATTPVKRPGKQGKVMPSAPGKLERLKIKQQ